MFVFNNLCGSGWEDLFPVGKRSHGNPTVMLGGKFKFDKHTHSHSPHTPATSSRPSHLRPHHEHRTSQHLQASSTWTTWHSLRVQRWYNAALRIFSDQLSSRAPLILCCPPAPKFYRRNVLKSLLKLGKEMASAFSHSSSRRLDLDTKENQDTSNVVSSQTPEETQ